MHKTQVVVCSLKFFPKIIYWFLIESIQYLAFLKIIYMKKVFAIVFAASILTACGDNKTENAEQ